MKDELTVLFLKRLLSLNLQVFKKAVVVKDIIFAAIDDTGIEECDSLPLLNEVRILWQQNMDLLVQKSSKIGRFEHRLNTRISELEDLHEEMEERQGE